MKLLGFKFYQNLTKNEVDFWAVKGEGKSRATGQFAQGQFAQKNEQIKLKKPNLT